MTTAVPEEPTSDTGALPVAVVGAGAAGLMAALWAARSGADVILLERTEDGGRKILISGGGRCSGQKPAGRDRIVVLWVLHRRILPRFDSTPNGNRPATSRAR